MDAVAVGVGGRETMVLDLAPNDLTGHSKLAAYFVKRFIVSEITLESFP